jgi:hypothetical protein
MKLSQENHRFIRKLAMRFAFFSERNNQHKNRLLAANQIHFLGK